MQGAWHGGHAFKARVKPYTLRQLACLLSPKAELVRTLIAMTAEELPKAS